MLVRHRNGRQQPRRHRQRPLALQEPLDHEGVDDGEDHRRAGAHGRVAEPVARPRGGAGGANNQGSGKNASEAHQSRDGQQPILRRIAGRQVPAAEVRRGPARRVQDHHVAPDELAG